MFAYFFQTWRGDRAGSTQADGDSQAKKSKWVLISGIRRTTNAGKDKGSGGKIRIQIVDAEGVRPDTDQVFSEHELAHILQWMRSHSVTSDIF
jgi:hypothetical protein